MTELMELLMKRHYYWTRYSEILANQYTEEEIESGYEALAEAGFIKNNKRSYKLTELGAKWADENIE